MLRFLFLPFPFSFRLFFTHFFKLYFLLHSFSSFYCTSSLLLATCKEKPMKNEKKVSNTLNQIKIVYSLCNTTHAAHRWIDRTNNKTKHTNSHTQHRNWTMIVRCQRPVAREREYEQCQCHIFNIYWPVYRWEINRCIFLSSPSSVPSYFNNCATQIWHFLSFVARQYRPPKTKSHIYFCTHVVILSTTDPLNHFHSSWKIVAIHSDVIYVLFFLFFQTQSPFRWPLLFVCLWPYSLCIS